MKIEKLDRPGALREWLTKTAAEGQNVVALDLEWVPRNGRDDEVYSGAVSGVTENDIGFFGASLLPELMEAPESITFVMHYASSDLKHLAWAGVPLHEKYSYEDTLILSHLLQENGDHDLGSLVKEHYADDYKAIFKSKYRLPQDAPEEENKIYNAKDTHFTRRLHNLLREGLLREGIPESLIRHVHSLQRSLLETEISGIAVDRGYLLEKGVELRTKIESILPQMRQAVSDEIGVIECNDWVKEIGKRKTSAGRARVVRPTFSFDSARQIAELLYGQLGIPEQRNEKTKSISVDYDSLEKIKDKHPIIAMIQEYREANKIYGTYIEGTLERMVEGRIYPSFNVAGTATGRISHSNPNMGNMPREGGIRGLFVPDEGYVFLSADFSQLEVCLSAHFTRDANLLRIINEGVSQHDITATSLGIPRNIAKTVNFGMQYGCSHYKVAKVLGVSEAEGKKAYDKYWETYSGQKRVMDECAAKVDNGEPITNPFGRRRRFEKRKRPAWDGAYRQSWNALVQGTGSDCTSRAFYTADASLRGKGLGRALFTVHDEIVIQVKKEKWEEGEKILLSAMKSVGEEIGLSVALKAESSGPMGRWED